MSGIETPRSRFPGVAAGPVARGVVLTLPRGDKEPFESLRRETLSILRALDAEGDPAQSVPADADFVVLILHHESEVEALTLPDLTDRAATAIAIADDAPAARGTIARARKRLRAQGAVLGARELVFSPQDFGILGLESDGLRERLEILLRALVIDAERVRLRREGWEDPVD